MGRWFFYGMMGWLVSAGLAWGGELQCGMAVRDITPPLPFPMAGYYHHRLSTGTSDPLLAKAMVFQQGDERVVLLICDTITINESVSTEIRRRVQEKLGILPEAVVITATHTHTGPIRDTYQPHITPEENAKAVAEGDYRKFNYSCFWVEQGMKAIEEAAKNLRPVALRVVRTNIDNLSFNRRFHMKDSSEVRFNPGIKNPNILRPAGPIDPDAVLMVLENPETAKPFASLSNFALHLDTTGGTLFSADYPFYLSEELRKKFGQDFLSFFGTAPCGDLNHIDVTGEYRRKAPQIGAELGEHLVKAWETQAAATALEKPALSAWSKTIHWNRRQYSAEEVQKAKDVREEINNPASKYTFLERVKAGMVLKLDKKPPQMALEVQVLRLSHDTAIVTLPGEIFVELGLAIKKASPFRNTLILELAQKDIIYVPTQKAFGEGSYETVNSMIEPGGGEKLVETALEGLNALKKSL